MNTVNNTSLKIQPLNPDLFSAYGEVLQIQKEPTVMINQGNCARYSDLAQLDFTEGRAGISIFHAKPYSLPYSLAMVERHPQGSQAFIPMTNDPFLVIVAADQNGVPAEPEVFISDGQQGVNYHRNTWHGVLTPINGLGLFAVVDRIGEGKNLEEYWFEKPYSIEV